MNFFNKLIKKIKICSQRVFTDLKKYVWIGMLLVGYYFFMHALFHAFCPVVIMTGFPCPGCGMIRAVLFMLSGEIKRGMQLNPVAAGWLALAVWIFIKRYWQGKKITGLKQTGIVLIIFMIVVYMYRMATVFPGSAPMTFRYDNILNMILPGYTQFMTSLF